MRKTFLVIAVLAISLSANVALAANVQSSPAVQQTAINFQAQQLDPDIAIKHESLLPTSGSILGEIEHLYNSGAITDDEGVELVAKAFALVQSNDPWAGSGYHTTSYWTGRADAYAYQSLANDHYYLYYRWPHNGQCHNFALYSAHPIVAAAITYYWLRDGGISGAVWYDSRYQYVRILIGDRATKYCPGGIWTYYIYLDVMYR